MSARKILVTAVAIATLVIPTVAHGATIRVTSEKKPLLGNLEWESGSTRSYVNDADAAVILPAGTALGQLVAATAFTSTPLMIGEFAGLGPYVKTIGTEKLGAKGVCDLIAAGGRLSRAEVLAPALELAEQGVAVTRDTAEALVDNAARLTRGGADVSPWVAARPAGVGAIVRLPETAATLRGIIERGPEAFYAGPVAAAIVAAVAREDGVMSLDDLAGHESVIREPVPVDYRGVTVLAQPPSSQAMLLTMALRRLAAEAPSDRSATAQHRAVEAIAGAFAYRDRITQDGADRELMELADAIPIGERASRADHAKGYNHTTSVTTADREGNVVSMLISVFDSFGCATWVPGGGFFLNDRLLSFARDPESPNAAAGGKRPVHTLSPAMVVDGRRIVGISTPSADGQVQALLQVLLAHLDERAEIGDACDRPRWRVVGDLLRVEEDIEPDLAAGLAALGHEVVPAPVGDSLFGSVCASEADLDSGLVSCWADPRRESWAGAW